MPSNSDSPLNQDFIPIVQSNLGGGVIVRAERTEDNRQRIAELQTILNNSESRIRAIAQPEDLVPADPAQIPREQRAVSSRRGRRPRVGFQSGAALRQRLVSPPLRELSPQFRQESYAPITPFSLGFGQSLIAPYEQPEVPFSDHTSSLGFNETRPVELHANMQEGPFTNILSVIETNVMLINQLYRRAEENNIHECMLSVRRSSRFYGYDLTLSGIQFGPIPR